MSGAGSTAGDCCQPDLRISLPARAENVAVVRHALAALAEKVGMGAAGVVDLKTVVTEACMNVVVHAYPAERPGLLEVEAHPAARTLTIVVRDFGSGISPRRHSNHSSLRLGLTLIAALSRSFEVRGGAGSGTEVRMRLELPAEQRVA